MMHFLVSHTKYMTGLMHWRDLEEMRSAPEDIYIHYMAELSRDRLDMEGLADEDIGLEDSEPIRVVICMNRLQSHRLVKARFIQSDIAFKRVTGFKEFEL